jgi:hypothetical protein
MCAHRVKITGSILLSRFYLSPTEMSVKSRLPFTYVYRVENKTKNDLIASPLLSKCFAKEKIKLKKYTQKLSNYIKRISWSSLIILLLENETF